MAINELKKELKEMIEEVNDEEVLNLMREDFAFYTASKQHDITDELSESQFEELKKLAEEDDESESESLEDFRKATSAWRTK